MHYRKNFYLYLSSAIAETIILIFFSFIPSVDTVRVGFLRPGDAEHFVAFSIYGFLWTKVLSEHKLLNRNVFLIVSLSFIIGSSVGAICEVIQYFVPSRTADIVDWLIDSVASLSGSLIVLKFKGYFFKSKQKAKNVIA